jgi:uncharacterized protein
MNALPRPWYREPMVWLVIGLPMLSVVAGTSLLTLAIVSGGDDAVADEVQRMSRIQLTDMRADQRAEAHDMQARLSIDPHTGALQLAISGLEDVTAERSLALMFVHPVKAADDRSLPLVRDGEVWLGRFDGVLDHAWQLRLTPPDRRWRLEGRLGAQQPQVTLRPRSTRG